MIDLVLQLVDFILHLDVHLDELVANYGIWIYAILFLIIFCETGLVVLPLLPGDSLLFAAGAARRLRAPGYRCCCACLLITAAILGNAVNYWVGRLAGQRAAAAFSAPDQAAVPGQDPRLLRALWRQDGHHRPLRAHRPDRGPVRRGRGPDDAPALPVLQRRGQRPLGAAAGAGRATSSPTCRSSRRTSRRSSSVSSSCPCCPPSSSSCASGARTAQLSHCERSYRERWACGPGESRRRCCCPGAVGAARVPGAGDRRQSCRW